MNTDKIKAKYAEKAVTASHFNLGVTVETTENGTIVTIPNKIGSEFVYESQTKDPKTGKAKGTVMVYCLPKSPDPKVPKVLVPVTVTDADGTEAKFMVRMGGFPLFIQGIEE